jgi:UDP-2-acetamido-3-amino-2,3-dideoxy-glucuronate N-acetyltransferase
MTNTFVHESAIIDPGAQIGPGTRIWHFCHLMPGAILGEDCILGQNVFVASGVRIGNGVKVQNNVSLYAGVEVEDHVFLGPSCVLTNVINPRANMERKHEYRSTLIRQGATVGANATILCGITLGAWCFIGAGAVVTRDVPDYALIAGNPGRQQGWMSRGGHRLIFDSDDQAFCPSTGDHYRLREGRVELLQNL